MLLKPLCLCGETLFLSGCTMLGVGESEYACDQPGKGVCKSARQVYLDISDSEYKVSAPEIQPTLQPTLPLDQNRVSEVTAPQRFPAKVLRIWIAPWVDKQGHWHSGGVVMSDIYPREWQRDAPERDYHN